MLAIVQLDAVDTSLTERLLGEGRLPTLAGLRERGVALELRTPATHFSAATYPALYSGRPPGETGVYYPFQWDAGSQRVRLASAFERAEPVWERLARAGRRPLVLDPYEAPRGPAGDGVVLSGWQFTNRVVLQPWSHPKRLRRQLSRRFGRGPAVDEVLGKPSISRLLRIRRQLLAGPTRAADAVCHLLERGRFDLLWVLLPPLHLGGHQFWDLSQLDGEPLDAQTREQLATALPDLYAAGDAAMGRILSALPPDADLIVLSPIGMTANATLPDVLGDLLAAVLGDVEAPEAAAERGTSPVWRLRAAVPTDLRAAVARVLPPRVALELTSRLETPKLDWSRTRAFALPSDVQGYIRLNLRGRERDGIVDPGEADELLDRIAEGLKSFHDEHGRPVVASVERSSSLEAGPRAGLLPDLVVRWTGYPAHGRRRFVSARFGEVRRPGAGSGRSGNHDDAAWAVVVPGRCRLREVGSPSILDIAPTICSLLGVDANDLPGKPLAEPA